MAKQTVGPLTRHLEKGVLALTGGALLYAIAVYGVVSPNRIGDGADAQGPADVDGQVRAAAESLRSSLLNAEPKVDMPSVAVGDLRIAAAEPLRVAGVSPRTSRPSPFLPPIPDIGGNIGPAVKIELVDIVQLEKPRIGLAQVGRTGLHMDRPNAFGTHDPPARSGPVQDLNWVTVISNFDRIRQENLARDAGYDAGRIETLYLGMDVESRMLLASGEWSEWRPVNTVAPYASPVYPRPRIFQDSGGWIVSEEDRNAVEQFIELVKTGEHQVDLLRPLFPIAAYGDPWSYPKEVAPSVLEMDAEFQDIPDCRYTECELAAVVIDPNLSFRKLMDIARKELGNQQFDLALQYAEEARKQADRDKDEDAVDKLTNDIKAAKKQAIEEQMRAPRSDTQLLWAHDANLGSVISGRTYQYRARARILNRYCGVPTLLKDPADANLVALIGPWSEPSDPVTIPADTVFFVKSAKKNRNEVRVEVFKWFQGEWLDKAFDLETGESIGKVTKVETPPDGQRTAVNFDTGGKVVHIDWERSFISPGRRNRPSEIAKTAALVYVDNAGNLHERLYDADKNSETYKSLRGIIWEPPRR